MHDSYRKNNCEKIYLLTCSHSKERLLTVLTDNKLPVSIHGDRRSLGHWPFHLCNSFIMFSECGGQASQPSAAAIKDIRGVQEEYRVDII